MRHRGDLTEAASLVVMAVVLALGGRALLAQLHAYAPAAVVLIGFGLLAFSIAIRRSYRAGSADRLGVTVKIAYVTGLALALAAVAFPARWSVGASIAALELALAFDVFTRFVAVREQSKKGG